MKPRVQWTKDTPDEVKLRVVEQLRANADEHSLGGGEIVTYNDGETSWRYLAQPAVCGCGTRWITWIPTYERGNPGPCPLCEPKQIEPADLSPEQRTALVRKLARTDAVHEMHVEIDKALLQGCTSENRWHHPDDLALIDELRKYRAQGFGELRDVRVELEGTWMSSRYDDKVTRQQESTITVVQRSGGVDHTLRVRGVLVKESRSLVER
jgi:hypothetical protein